MYDTILVLQSLMRWLLRAASRRLQPPNALIVPSRWRNSLPHALRLRVTVLVPLTAVVWLQPWTFPPQKPTAAKAVPLSAADALDEGDFSEAIRLANVTVQNSVG